MNRFWLVFGVNCFRFVALGDVHNRSRMEKVLVDPVLFFCCGLVREEKLLSPSKRWRGDYLNSFFNPPAASFIEILQECVW